MTFDWFEKMYGLVEGDRADEALDILFEEVDTLLRDDMDLVTEMFEAIDLSRLDTNLLVGVLSITLAGKEYLPSRPQLVQRVEERLRILASERIEGLMKGLR